MKRSSTSRIVNKATRGSYHRRAAEQDAIIQELQQNLEIAQKQTEVHVQELKMTKQELNMHKAREARRQKAKKK